MRQGKPPHPSFRAKSPSSKETLHPSLAGTVSHPEEPGTFQSQHQLKTEVQLSSRKMHPSTLSGEHQEVSWGREGARWLTSPITVRISKAWAGVTCSHSKAVV